MKKIDLGYGAIALEASGPQEWVDAVPDEFFEKNNIDEESVAIYRDYLKKASKINKRNDKS